MPIRIAHQKVGNSFTPYNRPLDDPSGSGGSEDSLARSSSSGQRQRASQTARKSTTPRSRLEELDQTSSPHIPPLPADPGPLILCDLCPFPLQAPYTGVDLNQPIRDIMTICQHRFHYACYMRFLTTAPIGSRGSCPKCGGNLLTDHRYWVNVTTNAGNQCYTDMTKEVEERFAAVRLARQQILFDFLNSGNLNLAAPLLTGPYAVDVNYRTPSGGFTPLHVCATYNNVAGINLLLSHGADQHQKSDEGFMAIDYANANNALAAVTQLT
ncbi:hypothetical protein C8F04DRAFT_1249559 [Mycena alexandri]|uniref:RING-type domain-containing protein n=1 Tax=Mycena alexandri TaxID=1745969 RepID=A0AAD6TGX5_9AGAR|nr:hypothetical protein C8F04DRAFT_1249559 [Mycena alexandri]